MIQALAAGGRGAEPAPGPFCCPECGHVTASQPAGRAGYCARCDEDTGMCGAGRRVRFIAGDVPGTGGAVWFTECGRAGDAGRWVIISADNHAGTTARTVLCTAHARALTEMADAGWVAAQPVSYASPQP